MRRDDDFGDFYQASYPRLVGQLTVMTGSLEDAEDAVQEAFARASTRWARLRDYDMPEAWVRRVALNLATSCSLPWSPVWSRCNNHSGGS
jgi:RNA polymerase sigma-70 factor (ECF subfamily)